MFDNEGDMKKTESKQNAAARNLDDRTTQLSIKKPTFLFVGITLILLATFFLSFIALKQFENAIKVVSHTNLVKEKLSALLSNLKDAETGQRGYLLTRDKRFLEPYIRTESINKNNFIELDSLLKDNRIQQKNLVQLNRLVTERTVILKRNIGLVVTNATNLNNQNALLQGNIKMDAVRKQVEIMIQVQDELLQQRILQKDRMTAIRPLFILGIFIIAMVALLLFFVGWRRETRLRILAQRQAIKNTEESENRIRSFFNEVPVGLCVLKGPDHIFEFANNAYLELVGITDVIGKSLSQVLPELETEGFISLLDNVYRTGKTFYSDEAPLMINQSGRKQQYISFSNQAFKNIDGEIEGILASVFDVTENVNAKKQVEEKKQELQKTAEYLKLATDAANVGIWSFDLKTQILSWSQRHKSMWGYDDEQLQDLSYEDWFRIILPSDKAKVVEKVEEARVNHTTYNVDYCINRENDGVLRCIHSVGKYYYNDSGEAETLTGISMDITEQKESDDKIKEARELFETTLQNVPSAIYNFDKTGKIVYLNELGANQIGYANIEDVLAEKDVLQLRKRAHETFDILNEQGEPMPLEQGSTALTFKTGKSTEVVTQLINKKTGASSWLLSKAAPLYDENGGLIKVIATSTDITLQKTSEQALRKSEEHFRTFANSMQNMAWIANADGGIFWFNQQWYDYTGSTLEEMEGWGWQKVHHPDYIKKVREFVDEALKRDEAFALTFPLRNFDGEYRWFLTHVYPLKDTTGKVERWIGTNTDITEQKRFSEELELKVNERTVELSERNIFIEALIDSSTDLIFAFDKDLRYLIINKAATQTLAASFPEGVIGKRIDEVLPNVHQSGVYANVLSALQGNIISQRGYQSYYGNKYFDVDFIPLRNEKEVYGVMAISRDVTENVLAGEILKTKNLALENANAELESFNYVASHDLQEPLRKIQTFGELILKNEKFSDQTQDYFNRMISAGERMQNLIVSLLDFSKASVTEVVFEPCDLNEIVAEFINDLQLSINEKQAIVEKGNLPTINGSPIQLSQLFTNLIDNAIKYSRPEIKPYIIITASIVDGKEIDWPSATQKEYHEIKIADNGIGFEKEYATKIFTIFQRLHGRQEYSGTGIGLAIVKKIVANHNGFIVAEGVPGIGSTFTIYIPVT